ncbi:Beta-propeller repeat protein [Posidoniimonas corsicana]|uniref:Beta-propeller repeat protein n=1 Tax=Posidoniimonas corsicana TaxID=1938618 RepID=A0A5C5UXB1_9BACT|nr:SBBP repeat-containing protein [Posidoniimonas corsicana]TWT31024.1 Beta-propeller repeat protein [Posidoniimonas corsicana]
MNRQVLILTTTLYFLSFSSTNAVTLDWIKQIGSAGRDDSWGTSADGLGNVYISGYTEGDLGGPNAGISDAFVSKFNSAGDLLWTRQLGSIANDYSRGVSADGLGNVYVSGHTRGDLGGVNAGSYDVFLSKFDSAGNLLWTEQLGSNASDEDWGVTADRLGGVYVSGSTAGALGAENFGSYDGFVSKYDSDGKLLWTEQIGLSRIDQSFGVSSDGLGNVYISGFTFGSLGGANAGQTDAFVSKYDASGNRLWVQQLGTVGLDESNSVSVDGLGNVYISGSTEGDLGGMHAGGTRDVFLSKLDQAGNLLWTRQLGTSRLDVNGGVSADRFGNVYLSGHTSGDLANANAGPSDAFLAKYDDEGNLVWTEQFGTTRIDSGFRVSVDGFGGVYLSGRTDGSLSGPNAGSSDAFLAKFSDPVPEPHSVLLGVFACVSLTLPIRGKRGARQKQTFNKLG